MSRARPIIKPDGSELWFDVKSGKKATDEQLELLATIEDIDFDDLVDYVTPTQTEVLDRLRRALGQGGIPPEIYEKRQKRREERRQEPECRICTKKGDSTKHHFVPKWMLKELSRYAEDFADRRKNTIPICLHCHRDLHSRDNGPHPIHERLDDDEKRFADEAITAFATEHLGTLRLIAEGDVSTYETQLVHDWFVGSFRVRN